MAYSCDSECQWWHSFMFCRTDDLCRADSGFATSQWERVLLCNDVSHWLGASLEPALFVCVIVVTWFVFKLKLTYWGKDKMAAVSQTSLSNTFSWMKMFEFWLQFDWSLFLRVQLTILQHWFRLWLAADQVTSHCLNQWWFDHWHIYESLNELTHLPLVPHICVSESGQHWFR